MLHFIVLGKLMPSVTAHGRENTALIDGFHKARHERLQDRSTDLKFFIILAPGIPLYIIVVRAASPAVKYRIHLKQFRYIIQITGFCQSLRCYCLNVPDVPFIRRPINKTPESAVDLFRSKPALDQQISFFFS